MVPRLTPLLIVAVALAAASSLSHPVSAFADTTATVTSTDGVNLRAGPATTYTILAVMPYGATVSVTGEATADNWLPVSYSGTSGYADGEYLSLTGSSAAAAASTPASAPAQAAPASPPASPAAPASANPTPPTGGAFQYATVIPPDGLNLRAGPATTYPAIITVPGGIRVQVVGTATADGWYSVVFSDKLGWVDGKYLNFTPAPGAGAINGGPAATTPPSSPSPSASPSPAASASSTGSSKFAWPVASRRISTLFSAAHPAIDIDEFPSGGNPVSAAADGTVTFAGGNACCSYGLYVIVTHAGGYTTLYAHLSVIEVTQGQTVKQGAELGKSGSTGNSTGAHLHFEIRKDGVAVDPLSLLPGSYNVE